MRGTGTDSKQTLHSRLGKSHGDQGLVRNRDLRRTEVLGAGDPGALEALFATVDPGVAKNALTEAYRRLGWRVAALDPLKQDCSDEPLELAPTQYGLTELEAAPLRQVYCGSIGWEVFKLAPPVQNPKRGACSYRNDNCLK